MNVDAAIVHHIAILSNNGYAYCSNSPISFFDPDGTWGLLAFLAPVAEAVASAAAVVASVAVVGIAVVATQAVNVIAEVVTDVVEGVNNAIDDAIDTAIVYFCLAGAIVNSIATKISIPKEETFDNSVYVLIGTDQRVHYVGITNDVDRRGNEHKNDTVHKGRNKYTMIVVATGLTRSQARTYEQVLISAYTIDAIENARREIAVKNLPKFVDELVIISHLLGVGDIPIDFLK